MKLFIIDTIATIFFFTIVATFNELIIAGIEPSQVLTTRLIMLPVMVATGRPYGLWRDTLFSYVLPQQHVAKIALDIVVFLSFQMPIYAGTLAIAGANMSEVTITIGSAIIFMIILSRPFGVFLDFVRRRFGVSAFQS